MKFSGHLSGNTRFKKKRKFKVLSKGNTCQKKVFQNASGTFFTEKYHLTKTSIKRFQQIGLFVFS